MSRIEDGGPAFPRPVSEDRVSGDQPDGNSTVSEQDGMTLRDYFAAKAMQSLVVIGFKGDQHANAVAHTSYGIADAMIAERNRRD